MNVRHAFFLSASDRRELVVTFNNNRPETPVFVYEEGKDASGFMPGETLFAFGDDAAVRWNARGVRFNAALVQITADDGARPGTLRARNVTFRLGIAKTDGEYGFVFRLDPQSRKELRKAGFHPDFPRAFRKPAPAFLFDHALLEQRKVGVHDLARLPFPPHHPTGRADKARTEFQGGRASPPVRITDNWEEPARIALGEGPGMPFPEPPANGAPPGGIVIVQTIPSGLPLPGGRQTFTRPRPRRVA